MAHPPSIRELSRRDFFRASAAGAVTLVSARISPAHATTSTKDTNNEPSIIGTRRELFVDDQLIANITGGAQQRLHHPVPREIALEHDESWEGSGSLYHSVFQDGGRYRMYYRGLHLDVAKGTVNQGRHPAFLCYAESEDGILWRKPNLNLHEFEGSKQNNIVMTSGPLGSLDVDAGSSAVFKDENPNGPGDGRYKAMFRSGGPLGLLPFESSDGIKWFPMTSEPLFQGLGAFDSQNLAFWDPVTKRYRAYWRIFTEGGTTDKEWKPRGYRAIRTASSDDFLQWGPHVAITYENSPDEHLYTNVVKPYHRAPHLLLGFPARYVERGWSESMRSLPEPEKRETRSLQVERYGTALTETLVMVSRDGRHFTRWNEAFLRPGIERAGAWNYGHQFMAWHLVETASSLPDAPNELSLYASEGYWHGQSSALRRYTLRLDGFVSVNAPLSGGELRTEPLVFDGAELCLNFATSAAGRIRVELQRPGGAPIEGYTLEQCADIFGDAVDRVVHWKGGPDVSPLAGQPVCIRFHLQDADLFAYQFKG